MYKERSPFVLAGIRGCFFLTVRLAQWMEGVPSRSIHVHDWPSPCSCCGCMVQGLPRATKLFATGKLFCSRSHAVLPRAWLCLPEVDGPVTIPSCCKSHGGRTPVFPCENSRHYAVATSVRIGYAPKEEKRHERQNRHGDTSVNVSWVLFRIHNHTIEPCSSFEYLSGAASFAALAKLDFRFFYGDLNSET